MYSGTTFRIKSGRIMAVHQRIDRVARRSIKSYIPKNISFPTINDVLHFEGKNGPDGIKSKSPGHDEPWHFIDPGKLESAPLLKMIDDHIVNLSTALSDGNNSRAAYEAAWLAHAVTDGMTAAHHYPLEDKINELRGENGLSSRNSIKNKIVLPGKNRREQFKNNWEFWGTKGVMTTHFGFEWGVMTSIAGQNFQDAVLNDKLLENLHSRGYREMYKDAVTRVDRMNMYYEYIQRGWTRNLAKESRDDLIPDIIRMVTLAWYAAIDGVK